MQGKYNTKIFPTCQQKLIENYTPFTNARQFKVHKNKFKYICVYTHKYISITEKSTKYF